MKSTYFWRRSRLGRFAWLAALLTIALSSTAFAQPAECRVGAFVTGLSPIDFGTQEVHLDAYAWMKCPSAVPTEHMTFSVVSANEEDRGEAYEENANGVRYRYERIRATLRVPLSLRRYPFDTQRIAIDLESSNATASEVRYVLDDDPALTARPCCLDDSVGIPDWRFVSVIPHTDLHRYRTHFGYVNATSDAQAFPRFRVEVIVHRQVWPYLWKVLLPLVIILAMGLASSFWPADNLEASSNVLIASLLSVVAAHLTQRSELPNTGYLVTGDWFFINAYFMLLLMLVVASRVNHLALSGHEHEALALQRRERRVIPVLAIAGWSLVIAVGMRS